MRSITAVRRCAQRQQRLAASPLCGPLARHFTSFAPCKTYGLGEPDECCAYVYRACVLLWHHAAESPSREFLWNFDIFHPCFGPVLDHSQNPLNVTSKRLICAVAVQFPGCSPPPKTGPGRASHQAGRISVDLRYFLSCLASIHTLDMPSNALSVPRLKCSGYSPPSKTGPRWGSP